MVYHYIHLIMSFIFNLYNKRHKGILNMSIIEKKKTDLLISEPVKTLDIPEFDGYNYIKTELDKLKKVEDKNIKLALRLKEIRDKYNEIKHQYKMQCSILVKLNKLNIILSSTKKEH